MGYGPHELMVEPARAGAELWRIVAGILLSIAIFLFSSAVLGAALLATAGEDRFFRLFDGNTPADALFVLLSIVLIALGPVLLARPLHKRTAVTLLGPLDLCLRDFFRTIPTLAAVSLIVFVFVPWDGDETRAMSFESWVMLIPLSLSAILLQTGSEEVAFRGYLQSQLAARFQSPLIWIGAPAALFAFGHYAPEAYGDYAFWVAFTSGVFAVAAADLTARTGNLGAAIALHFVNNVAAFTVLAPAGDLAGLALFTYPFNLDDSTYMNWVIVLDILHTFVFWLAARVALRV